MGMRVAVAGASGYAGGELLRLIARHPHLELAVATGQSQAGQPIGAVHPHLPQFAGYVFAETGAATLAEADLVFLALPHGESAAIARQLPPATKVVDLGADHRLVDPMAWTLYYPGPHAGAWTYGLPELPGQREAIAGSTRVAATGCYAVATILALAPLIAAGIASPDDVVVVAASGTSGAGRSLKPHLLASEVMGSLTPYKVGAHQHVPEIMQATGARSVSFTPVLAPMPRGILGTVTVSAPKGFRASGVAAGLKASNKPDVALVVNDGPDATAAGVFTTNRVKAAPVLWSQQVLRAGIVRAVILNSGGANACTGAQGFQDTHRTAERVGARLTAASRQPIGAADVAVCSTGLIGERLPMDKLLPGVDAAVRGLARDGGLAAAEAIMTTDTRPKTTVKTGEGYTVGGMAKGAGMLAPGLATMLSVLTTDAVADSATLDATLREACRITFERVDSDGCMSTNDTVLLLASGASGIQPTPDELLAVVTAACHDLAGQLIADAEGATKDVTIDVVNAASEDDAVEVGRS